MQPNSYYLARRLSNRNEHDFLQESMFDDEDCSSREMCKVLADNMSKMKDPIAIPLECKQYPELMVDLTRKNSKETSPSAFVGSNAGLVRQAQLTRRMTAGTSGLAK